MSFRLDKLFYSIIIGIFCVNCKDYKPRSMRLPDIVSAKLLSKIYDILLKTNGLFLLLQFYYVI
jgi:hypothetical protein